MTVPHLPSTIPSTAPNRRTNRRTHRPERIEIEGDTAVRNDLIAQEQGATERTINRDDAKGAPFMYFGGVKYRPIGAYKKFLASKIKMKGQPPKRRRSRRA